MRFCSGPHLLPIAESSGELVERSFTFRPPISGISAPLWFIFLAIFFLLSATLAFYLYRAQRSIASRGIVATLTLIRLLLILLVFGVLTGVGRAFSYTRNAGGTLWLLVDQSQSMTQTDPQSTPIERLRWADAFGYLPPEKHASPLSQFAAQLDATRADLNHLQAVAAGQTEASDPAGGVQVIVQSLQKAHQRLVSIAESIDKESSSKSVTAKPLQSLRQTTESLGKAFEKAQGRAKREEIAADVPWREIQLGLTRIVITLNELATQADRRLVESNDASVQSGLKQVEGLTRARLAEMALIDGSRDNRAAVAVRNIIPKQNLKVLGFGQEPQMFLPDSADAGIEADVRAIHAALQHSPAPSTDLVSALRTVADQVGASEPATVVVVSDGRQNRNGSELADAAGRLAARGIRVFSLAVGSREIAPDAAVENVDAPDWVFKGDTLKLSAMLRIDGLYQKDAAGSYGSQRKSITVELHRTRVSAGAGAEELLDTQTIDLKIPAAGDKNQANPVATFSERKDQTPEPGLYDYRISIKPVENESITQNNSQSVRVAVKDHKLAALVIEDQPRYDYRYAVNYLGRDNRVKLQTLLLQAARIEHVTPPLPAKASPDNLRTEAQILPQTQEDWYAFDLIILGDIPPESISRSQQAMIVKSVTERGATLIIVAGALNMPSNWGADKAANPLVELFPVEASSEWTPQSLQAHLRSGYRPDIAPDGREHLLTQFGIDPSANAAEWADIQKSPEDPRHPMNWYWHSEYTQARSGAQVIWQVRDNGPRPPADARPADIKAPTELENAQRRALLATMNVGLGKVMYLAGDATWRLRQVDGKNLHERFWGQVIRWVAGNELPAGGQYVRFGTDKPHYIDGESAIVTARVFDKHLAPLVGQKFKVVARPIAMSGAAAPGSASAEAEMIETPESPGQYRATLGSLPAGQVELSLVGDTITRLLADDPAATQKTLTVDLQKGLNLEQKNINTDRPTLATLSQAGNGVLLDANFADVLADHLPNLDYKITTAEQIGLFADPKDPWTRNSHWIFLGVFTALVTAEWVIRKMGGLV